MTFRLERKALAEVTLQDVANCKKKAKKACGESK
jgi:hypothetical protein